ncbi:hypothetical protein ID866_4990 [Astraeus odoratus]|nr:hypothetical protein ID866_4990 [Astraeus odoratus]
MQDNAEPSVGSKRAQSPRLPPAKRAKASQACLSCRKHKTRCEILDGDSGVQCHRCKVLSLPCSFEDSNGHPVTASSSRAQTHVTDPPKADGRSSIPVSNKMQGVPDNSFNHSRSTPKSWDEPTSDTLIPFRDQPQEKVEVDLSDPQQLLPERQRPWGLLKLPGGFDGTTVPMLAMQALLRSGVNGEEALKNKIDQSLLRILGRERQKYLMDIFEQRYSPWLNLQPNYHNDSPIVQLAQCCVASRHLDIATRAVVAPQLYRLADEAMFKQAFSPLPSTEAIYATLIHSLWCPVGDSTSRETRDGRLVAATAVSMAMNLRLSEAMTYASTLGNQKKPNEPPSAELVEALDKARLWFALNNVETMLCYGTGRDAVSDCSKLIHDAIATNSMASVPLVRDMRLTLTSQLLAITSHGLSLCLKSRSELAAFHKDMTELFSRMDIIERLTAPLPEHEVFHFCMLQIYYQSFRLLVLLHGMMELKRVYEEDGVVEPWFELVELNGVKLVLVWGSRALVIAEGVLITMISRSETALLSAAPDYFFAMISLSTLYVILSKWSAMEKTKEPLRGSCDSLLARTVQYLTQISCSPDHSAARCARVIEEGMSSVHKKLSTYSRQAVTSQIWRQRVSSAALNYTEVDCNRDMGYSSMPPTAEYTECVGGTPPLHEQAMNSHHTLSSFPMSDPNYFNSEIFFDTEFWSSFMANMSDENGLYMGR